MTTLEFSTQFDILYNNISSNQAPGLNEYEKSVFLTKAQYEIIKNYFNAKGNKYQEGFDENAKRQIDFSNIITTVALTEVASPPIDHRKLDVRSVLYKLPDKCMMILNEVIHTKKDELASTPTIPLTVVPISVVEYTQYMSKPYKYPLRYQAWRLITDNTTDDTSVEVILPPYYNGENATKSYICRYIKRPKPIILCDLGTEYSELSIEGIKNTSECELDPSLHQEILQRAVELAKNVYEGNLQTTVELGNRSE